MGGPKYNFKGQKNPNNPNIHLKHIDEVLIIKKANFINCMTCYWCVGENVYKVYKYRNTGHKPVIDDDYDM